MCESALLLLQLEDSLFDGVSDRDFVDDYVDGLVESMNAIDGLFFDEWVPEGLEDHDSTRRCEIEAETAAFQTAEENATLAVVAEALK